MSNSMLEQAIIDAETLKEAAVKNAEQAIVEKYSADIKKAVNQLLEQEEDPMAMEDTPEEETDFQKEVPDAHSEDEKLCPCPSEDEEVEIDFDELAKRIETEEENLEAGDMTDREAFGDEELEGLEEVLAEILSENEEIEISEKAVAEILANESPKETDSAEPVVAEGEEDGDLEEETKKDSPDRRQPDVPQDRLRPLEEKVRTLTNKIKNLKEENNKIKSVAGRMKEKLDEVTLTSAKLHYTNRVLASASLNERQRVKIVEAISKAVSVEETKTIFETLQSAVGGASAKVTPKSLNEVVNKRSSAFLPRKEQEPKSSSFASRMKVLAGIDKE